MANSNELDEIFKPLTPKILALSGGLGVKLDQAKMEVEALIAQREAAAIQSFGERLLAKSFEYQVTGEFGGRQIKEAVPVTAIQEELGDTNAQ